MLGRSGIARSHINPFFSAREGADVRATITRRGATSWLIGEGAVAGGVAPAHATSALPEF
jgi:hypothetical protein